MAGLRSSINAKCRDCIYDPLAPGRWRQQVGQCSVISCPLWPVRPLSSSDDPTDPETVTEEWVKAPAGMPLEGAAGALSAEISVGELP